MDRSRIDAFLSYLLILVGSLYILIFQRRDNFARYHANQALGLILFSVGLFVGWALIGWLVILIPLVGPVLAVSFFALVIGGWIFVVVAWLIGMINALNGVVAPLPLIGRWAEGLPFARA